MKNRIIFTLSLLLIFALTMWQSYLSRFGSFSDQTIWDINYSIQGDFMMYSMANGTVFGEGNNDSGQLALGQDSLSLVDEPLPVINYDEFGILSSVVLTTVGDNHVSVLLEDGYVLTWGDYDNFSYEGIPTIVKTDATTYLTNVVHLDSTSNVSMALDGDGQLWVWGTNTYNLFGHQGTYSPYAIPVVDTGGIPLTNVIDFSLGDTYAVALCDIGVDSIDPLVEVLGWGTNLPFSNLGVTPYPTQLWTSDSALGFDYVYAGPDAIALIDIIENDMFFAYDIYLYSENNNYLTTTSTSIPTKVYTSYYPFVYLGNQFIIVTDNEGVMLYQGTIGSRNPVDTWTLVDANKTINALTEGQNNSLYIVSENSVSIIQ